MCLSLLESKAKAHTQVAVACYLIQTFHVPVAICTFAVVNNIDCLNYLNTLRPYMSLISFVCYNLPAPFA